MNNLFASWLICRGLSLLTAPAYAFLPNRVNGMRLPSALMM